MERKYFFTNDSLGLILTEKPGQDVDWEACGFSVREIARAVQNGHQGFLDNEFVTVFPIYNIEQFNKSLGGIVAGTPPQGIFYKVINETEALETVGRLTKLKSQT